jgi:hypothetical protein
MAPVAVTVTEAARAPIVIHSPVMESGSRFSFRITGQAGDVYLVQAAPAVTGTWADVSVVTNNDVSAEFDDHTYTNLPRCFYRIKLLPTELAP